MNLLTIKEAIIRINTLSKNSVPFLFLINYDMTENYVLTKEELINTGIYFRFGNFSEYDLEPIMQKNFLFDKIPIDFDTYSNAFDYVQSELLKGNSYLVNLTFPSKVYFYESLLDIYRISNAKYKLYFKDRFVVFSPESFIQIHNNIISTYPMKGTINANIPNAEKIILSNVKEMAEHVTIVDLLRNDLSIVSKNVRVDKFRFVDHIKTNTNGILQVSSKISGILRTNFKNELGDIIFSLLPAGSITGAPKKKTIEIIKNAEIDNRGFYTGIMGWFDGNNLDSAVMIRFIEKNNENYLFRSGGGITHLSEKFSEYNELVDKIYVPLY